MTALNETHAEMDGRCEFVFEIDRGPARPGPDYAIGVILVNGDRFLAIEVGVGESGVPFVTLKSVGADGTPTVPALFPSTESVLVTP